MSATSTKCSTSIAVRAVAGRRRDLVLVEDDVGVVVDLVALDDCSYGTSASSFEQNRRCSMRAPSSRWTSRKETVFDSVAVCSFTGTVISPKAIVPFQIDRAMPSAYPVARPRVTPGAG